MTSTVATYPDLDRSVSVSASVRLWNPAGHTGWVSASGYLDQQVVPAPTIALSGVWNGFQPMFTYAPYSPDDPLFFQISTDEEHWSPTFAYLDYNKTLDTYYGPRLSSGVPYYFRAQTFIYGQFASHYSNTVSLTIPAIPNNPSNIQAKVQSASSIELAWVDDSTNEDHFEVQWSDDGWITWHSTTTDANQPHALISNLTPGTPYQFQVRATNSGGQSTWTAGPATTIVLPTVSIALYNDGVGDGNGSEEPDPLGFENGPTPMTLIVTRTGGNVPAQALDVQYTVAGYGPNPATDGSDDSPGNSVTLAANRNFAIFTVGVQDDAQIETAFEGVQVTLTGGAGYTTTSSTTATIRDNDFRITYVAISFDSQGLKGDSGSPYSEVQWVDEVDDPDPLDSTSLPLSFARSLPAQGGYPAVDRFVSARVLFELEGNPARSQYTLIGNASGSGGGMFNGKVTLGHDASGLPTLSGSAISGRPLPITIKKRSDLLIQWIVSDVDTPLDTITGCTSSNPLYVTGTAAPNEFETVVRIGCEGADGLDPGTQQQQIVTGIWNEFSGTTVVSVSGSVLKYWGPLSSQYFPPNDDLTARLLYWKDGICGCWAKFLVDTLRSQGVANATVVNAQIWPDYAVGGSPYGGGKIRVKASLVGKGSVPGLQVSFSNHAIVRWNNLIMDPSYGGQIYNGPTALIAEKKWAVKSIDVLRYYNQVLPSVDVPGPTYWYEPAVWWDLLYF